MKYGSNMGADFLGHSLLPVCLATVISWLSSAAGRVYFIKPPLCMIISCSLFSANTGTCHFKTCPSGIRNAPDIRTMSCDSVQNSHASWWDLGITTLMITINQFLMEGMELIRSTCTMHNVNPLCCLRLILPIQKYAKNLEND